MYTDYYIININNLQSQNQFTITKPIQRQRKTFLYKDYEINNTIYSLLKGLNLTYVAYKSD